MNEKVIFTAFECDRCGSPNATRLQVVIAIGKDDRPVFKDYDLCNRCVLAFSGALMNKLPHGEREAWMKAFVDGIIK